MFCESFAKVARELRESWGWDLKGGALSFSQLPHFHTYSLSLCHSLLLSLSQCFTSLCHSLSQSFSSSLPLSLSLSHSCCLSLSLSLSLFLFLLLNDLVIRIMHGDGSAKVSRKYFFLVKLVISGTRNLGQHPYISTFLSLPSGRPLGPLSAGRCIAGPPLGRCGGSSWGARSPGRGFEAAA